MPGIEYQCELQSCQQPCRQEAFFHFSGEKAGDEYVQCQQVCFPHILTTVLLEVTISTEQLHPCQACGASCRRKTGRQGHRAWKSLLLSQVPSSPLFPGLIPAHFQTGCGVSSTHQHSQCEGAEGEGAKPQILSELFERTHVEARTPLRSDENYFIALFRKVIQNNYNQTLRINPLFVVFYLVRLTTCSSFSSKEIHLHDSKKTCVPSSCSFHPSCPFLSLPTI